jgi:putative secretion ATPase (PEP-CTERM system associated)
MYTDYYGLTTLPFQLTPDALFYFESRVHSRAMAHLKYGLQQGEGFIVITGDIGAGKTTLVERLCATLDPDRYVIAKISSTQTTADDMLRMIAAGFGIQAENLNKGDLIKRFEAMASTHCRAGRRLLLLVDEAQNLSLTALEELRMLSNFIVGNKAPLQSFLLGQPQFRPTVALPEMEQLRQRVLASYHLGPLAADETRCYIEHRLRVAGRRTDPKFTDDSFARIHDLTHGVPRKINTLCSRLLLFGFLEEIRAIDGETVVRVAGELDMEVGGDALAAVRPAQYETGPLWPARGRIPATWPFPIPEAPFRRPVNGLAASLRGRTGEGRQLFSGSWDNATRYVMRRFS